jgi:hypothetical protein
VSSGLAGIISVGAAGDYAFGDLAETPFPETNVRHLVLKDLQVLAANPALPFEFGTAPVADGEVLNQQASPFCNQFPAFKEPPRLGQCTGMSVVTTRPSNGGPVPTWAAVAEVSLARSGISPSAVSNIRR